MSRLIKRKVIVKGATVLSMDGNKAYKNRQIYYVEYFRDGKVFAHELEVKYDNGWNRVKYIMNGRYQLINHEDEMRRLKASIKSGKS